MLNNMDTLILSALREDISHEDISTNSVLREATPGKAQLICKQPGVLAGLPVFQRVFTLLDSSMSFQVYAQDGDVIESGMVIADVYGDLRSILSGERTALNYLQRMSGIATHTRKISDLLNGSGTRLLDTRKTTPNNRIFEKYAVRIGGGQNHRFNLSDGVMLKDNHIAAAGGIANAVRMARKYAPFVHKIEVEAESLDMVREALEAGADIIMLDNMNQAEMKEAIAMTRGRALVECSGNITLDNIGAIIETGADYVSCGALTHSSPILDFSLKNMERT
jgi:nicotinate-nucleotide pyrophosphorylase (carboxylating)